MLPGIKLPYAFFFSFEDDMRVGIEPDGSDICSGSNSSRTLLLSEPAEPGRPWPLLHAPGESPGRRGEGKGVISVMAAKAGELIVEPEPGEREWNEAMLAAESVDLSAGFSIAMGWDEVVELPGLLANSLWPALSRFCSAPAPVELGVCISVRMWRSGVLGERVGVWCEGVRMWTTGVRIILLVVVSRAGSWAFRSTVVPGEVDVPGIAATTATSEAGELISRQVDNEPSPFIAVGVE
jgi:hypothetical protein